MGFLLLLALAAQTEPAKPSDKQILEWIQALSSDAIEKRNEAFRKLEEAGDAAVPHLRGAMKSSDAELQGRCRELITRTERLQPGVRKTAGVGVDVPAMMCNPELKKEFEALATSGRIDELLKRDYDWLTYAFDGLLSDEKPVVLGSLQFIHGMIRNRSLPDATSPLAKEKPDIRKYRSVESRAEEYTFWAQWWYTVKARTLVAEWAKEPCAGTEDWEEALRSLRGGWADGKEKERYDRIRSFGKSAYPYLVKYIDFEDTAVGNTAVTVLRALTERQGKDQVTAATKAAIKAEWTRWLDSQN